MLSYPNSLANYAYSCTLDRFPDGWIFFVEGKEENEPPGWTQLKLPGQAPSPRCGHTMASGGPYVIV